LICSGVALVVEPVQLESLHDGGDILLGGNNARIVSAPHQFGHNQRGQYTHDYDDYHNFNQGEPALRHVRGRTFAWGKKSVKFGTGSCRSVHASIRHTVQGTNETTRQHSEGRAFFNCWI